MKKTLFISATWLLAICCSKNENVTPALPPVVVNQAEKFIGTFDAHDTGYYSRKWHDGRNYGCITPMVIDRAHESIITQLTHNTFKISNYFGDSLDVECVIKTDTTFYASLTYIKQGSCKEVIMWTGNGASGNPIGRISSNRDTIIIKHKFDKSLDAGLSLVHYINNYTSTFIRKK